MAKQQVTTMQLLLGGTILMIKQYPGLTPGLSSLRLLQGRLSKKGMWGLMDLTV